MILYWGFGFGALLAFSYILHTPFLMFGLASGLSTPIPWGVMILIGLIVKRVLMCFMGKTWVLRYRAFILGGLALGEGMAAIMGVAIGMAAKATWMEAF